ncbi:MAG: branched-chain amino acid ABC transporter permease [Stellaceae bacterium]
MTTATQFVVTRSTRGSRWAMRGVLVGMVVLATAPYWAGTQDLQLLSELFGYVMLASLWNLLAGYAGLISIGQQAFVGLGGYALFSYAITAGANPLWAFPLAGLVGAIVAVPSAALLFRLRGAYFAIGSWVLADTLKLVFAQIRALGSGSGTSLPVSVILMLGHRPGPRESVIYWSAFVLLVLVMGTIVWLLRSRYGMALTAVRDNEVAARSSGIDVGRVKLVVYVFAGFATSMVGGLIFLQKLRISPDAAFSVDDWTGLVIFMAVIGGVGSVEGPVIGAVIFFVFRQELYNLGTIYLMLLGLVAIIVMLRMPKGIWGWASEHLGWRVLPLQQHVSSASIASSGYLPERSEP